MGKLYLLESLDLRFSTSIYLKTGEKNQIAKFSFWTFFEINMFVSQTFVINDIKYVTIQ